MNAPAGASSAALKTPVDVAGSHFVEHRVRYDRCLREEAPVHRGRIKVIAIWILSCSEDC